GAPARLLGLLALMPVPLSVCAGAVTVVLMTPRPEKDLKDPSVRATVVALEAGVVVTCAALVYGLGWLVAGAGGLSATRPDPISGAGTVARPARPDARSPVGLRWRGDSGADDAAAGEGPQGPLGAGDGRRAGSRRRGHLRGAGLRPGMVGRRRGWTFGDAPGP